MIEASFTWLWRLYIVGKEAGVPIDIIIIVVGFVINFGMSIIVYKLFSNRNNKSLEILSDMQAAIEAATNVNQEAANALASQTFLLQSILNGNTTLDNGQASKIYEKAISETFSQVAQCYFETKDYIDSKLNNVEDLAANDESYETIRTLVHDKFKELSLDIVNFLGDFSHKGNNLSDYINDAWSAEFNHIQDSIFTRLISRKNGISSYLKGKQKIFISDFEIYLRN